MAGEIMKSSKQSLETGLPERGRARFLFVFPREPFSSFFPSFQKEKRTQGHRRENKLKKIPLDKSYQFGILNS